MVAATNRVDELSQQLKQLNPEEALQFMEVCEADMRQRTTRYVFLFVSQAMSAMTSWETAGIRRTKALSLLVVLDKFPSQWDDCLSRVKAILDSDDAEYWQFDEAGKLLRAVLLESHLAISRDWPEVA